MSGGGRRRMNLHTGALSCGMVLRSFDSLFSDVVKLKLLVTLTSPNARLGLRIVGCRHSTRCRERVA